MIQLKRVLCIGWLVVLAAGSGSLAGCDGTGDTPQDVDAAQVLPPIPVSGPDGRIDFAYDWTLTDADPTDETRTYSVTLGALPDGLALSAEGRVTGTPTASGTYEAVVWGDAGCGEAACRLELHVTIQVLPVILLSGYGPFQGVPDNPSWAAVAPLDEALIGGYDVRTFELTVTWDGAWATYEMEYERLHPAIALGAGVAMGELAVRLESRAANYAQGEDVDGVVLNGPIDPDGDDLDTGLPLAELLSLLQDNGYPVVISDFAGTYLCNYLFYQIMRRVEDEPPAANILGGFVHVPGEDVVSIPDMTDAWELVLEYLTSYRDAL